MLNEPFYKVGIDGRPTLSTAQYCELLQAGYLGAKRADPDCVVIGGPAMDLIPSHLVRYAEFCSLGGLSFLDAINQHTYLGDSNCQQAYDKLNGLMDANGGRKPIWVNECGTYGMDETDSVCQPEWLSFAEGRDSEQLAAEALVRQYAVALGNGAQKVMQHPEFSIIPVNRESPTDALFTYGGAPRKAYVALNVLAWMLPPGTRFEKRMVTDDIACYVFRRGEKCTAVIWSENGTALPSELRRLANSSAVTFLDLMGNPVHQKLPRLSMEPVYAVGDGAAITEALNEEETARNRLH
jgi:hypothetical protein